MKKMVCLLFIVIITGCKLRPDNNIINAAAIHFAGVFITSDIHSDLQLRIKGNPVAKIDTADSDTYHVSGMVEGYSSYNVPFSIEHFNETLHYLGGNPNERNSWDCIEYMLGVKK
jgi:hypothetical protein